MATIPLGSMLRGRTAARASATISWWPIWSNAPITSAAHRRAVPGARRPADRLSRLLSERLCPSDIEAMCTHPNVGAVLLVSLGCEEFTARDLRTAIQRSGRPVEVLVIQARGGTRATVEQGRAWVARAHDCRRPQRAAVAWRPGHRHQMRRLRRLQRHHHQPAVGHAFDLLVDEGGNRDVRGAGRADRLRGAHGRAAP